MTRFRMLDQQRNVICLSPDWSCLTSPLTLLTPWLLHSKSIYSFDTWLLHPVSLLPCSVVQGLKGHTAPPLNAVCFPASTNTRLHSRALCLLSIKFRSIVYFVNEQVVHTRIETSRDLYGKHKGHGKKVTGNLKYAYNSPLEAYSTINEDDPPSLFCKRGEGQVALLLARLPELWSRLCATLFTRAFAILKCLCDTCKWHMHKVPRTTLI
ncbi:MAG: hypothetical protein J3Q66DRAFT_168835 [Benniella sp.]|nr:MAG: hypothetical protein J3Q66DRAFT_168835 [Benniella sp.]